MCRVSSRLRLRERESNIECVCVRAYNCVCVTKMCYTRTIVRTNTHAHLITHTRASMDTTADPMSGKPVILVTWRRSTCKPDSATFAGETEPERLAFVSWFVERLTREAELWAGVTGFRPEVVSDGGRTILSFRDDHKVEVRVVPIETEPDRLALFDLLIDGVLDPWLRVPVLNEETLEAKGNRRRFTDGWYFYKGQFP